LSKSYRKIGKYTKSSKKYMAEKRRRREILALYNQGLTQVAIASKLGVSVKTVERDFRKLHGYLERLKWLEQQKISEIFNKRATETLNQVPKMMRFRLVGSLMGADKRTKNRAFDALLAGDVPRLLHLIRRHSE